MAEIIAQAFPTGVTSGGYGPSLTRVQTTDDLPADAFGECIAECVHKAWQAGFDPAGPTFVIVVSFS